jgi:hypothetical protein
MARRLGARGALLVTLLLAWASAAALHRLSPPPLVDTRRGSEQAFARGLEPREIEDGLLARRWAGRSVTLSFVNLPRGPVELLVEVRSQRHPVMVALGGAVLGTLAPGVVSGRYALPEPRGGRVDLELSAETFVARGGRQLGFILDRVLVSTAPAGLWPPLSLVLTLALPAVSAFLLGRWVGLEAGGATAAAAVLLLVQVAALFRYGLVRSPYARELSFWLVIGTLLGLAFASWVRRSGSSGFGAEGARWAFVGVLTAFLVQGIAAAHPCLVASDAVFHAHNLQAVSFGDFWLTSLTPHYPPYRFPYGVSFYVALVPLLHTGLDLATLVRVGASASAVLASAALFWMLAPGGAARAGMTVVLLQLLPVTFDLLGVGNYSNVFAQSLMILFLAWWSGPTPGGWPVGALLMAAAATAHFGGLLFLLSLSVFLAVAERRTLDRPRVMALAVGLGLAAAYYLQFLTMVMDQVPRVVQGGGAAGAGFVLGLAGQMKHLAREWGIPALLLALVGLRARPFARGERAVRSLAALALAGVPFLLAAAGSALEVRYLYAVAPVVALLSAEGVMAGARQPMLGILAAVGVVVQAAIALTGIARATYERYRA